MLDIIFWFCKYYEHVNTNKKEYGPRVLISSPLDSHFFRKKVISKTVNFLWLRSSKASLTPGEDRSKVNHKNLRLEPTLSPHSVLWSHAHGRLGRWLESVDPPPCNIFEAKFPWTKKTTLFITLSAKKNQLFYFIGQKKYQNPQLWTQVPVFFWGGSDRTPSNESTGWLNHGVAWQKIGLSER